MENIAGAPVEAENFFGREHVIENLQLILLHDDVLLLGPRRIGKTSTARAVMAAVRLKGWRAIEVNVASCVNECDFLSKLEEKLTPELASFSARTFDKVSDAFKVIGNRISSVKIPIPGSGSFEVGLNGRDAEDWTVVGSDVLCLIAQADEPWLIYLDELPIMLFNILRNDQERGTARIRRFLDWFRNDVRALPGSKKVRWLVSGSIGLDTLVQEQGMSDTINSMNHQGLEAFTVEVARELLIKLADTYSIKLSKENVQQIIDAINWPQPYYLQKAFNHLRMLTFNYPNEGITALIEKTMQDMIEPKGDNDFHHWERRLDLQLSKTDAQLAIAMLTYSATTQEGAKPTDLLDIVKEKMHEASDDNARQKFIRLRDILLRDGYWQSEHISAEKRYSFRLELLRRWWLRRNEL